MTKCSIWQLCPLKGCEHRCIDVFWQQESPARVGRHADQPGSGNQEQSGGDESEEETGAGHQWPGVDVGRRQQGQGWDGEELQEVSATDPRPPTGRHSDCTPVLFTADFKYLQFFALVLKPWKLTLCVSRHGSITVCSVSFKLQLHQDCAITVTISFAYVLLQLLFAQMRHTKQPEKNGNIAAGTFAFIRQSSKSLYQKIPVIFFRLFIGKQINGLYLILIWSESNNRYRKVNGSITNNDNFIDPLKGRAVKCYTLPSRSNLRFWFLTFGHYGAQPWEREFPNVRNYKCVG